MSKTKPLIGIIGHARAGKDTAARYLIDNHGYRRLALADALREAALALDPIITGGDSYNRLSFYVHIMGWEKAKSLPEIRRTLQRLGTEAGWKLHGEDLWTRRLDRIMETGEGPYVITDIRQPHELDWLRDKGGYPLGIRRGEHNELDSDNSRRSSEASVDEMLTTVPVINNNGSIEQLHDQVETFYRKTLASNPGNVAGNAGSDTNFHRVDDTFAIARLDPRLPYPYRAHADDAGIDLFSAETFDLEPGQRHLASTGIAMRLPTGTVGLIHPRSGLGHKKGVSIVNAPGTIDAGYRGEVKVNLINLDPESPVHIERGDRIAQFVLQDVRLDEPIEITPDELTATDRGSHGHGSTGTR